jgi:hypothetical protein
MPEALGGLNYWDLADEIQRLSGEVEIPMFHSEGADTPLVAKQVQFSEFQNAVRKARNHLKDAEREARRAGDLFERLNGIAPGKSRSRRCRCQR